MNTNVVLIKSFVAATLLLFHNVEGSKIVHDFGIPFISDSLKTLMIPLQKSQGKVSASKFSASTYYTDLLVYDFTENKKVLLFNRFAQIYRIFSHGSFRREYGVEPSIFQPLILQGNIFIAVRENDTNSDKIIDEDDPLVIYTCDKNGKGLRKLTNEKVNAIDIKHFPGQQFFLIKIQFDSNNDKSFNRHDSEYGYLRVDLNTMSISDTLKVGI